MVKIIKVNKVEFKVRQSANVFYILDAETNKELWSFVLVMYDEYLYKLEEYSTASDYLFYFKDKLLKKLYSHVRKLDKSKLFKTKLF